MIPILGWADLLRCQDVLGDTGRAWLAQKIAVAIDVPESQTEIETESLRVTVLSGSPTDTSKGSQSDPNPSDGQVWWMPTQFVPTETAAVEPDDPLATVTPLPIQGPCERILARPLVPWSRLWPVLRQQLGQARRTRQIDWPPVIRRICRAETLRDLDRTTRWTWARKIYFIPPQQCA